jgi:DNA polymerase zeta
LDCPWLYARKRAEDRVEVVETINIIVEEMDRGRLRISDSEEISDSNMDEE